MSATIKASKPDEKTIAWFVKNVGPRTHYLQKSVGGKGWRFYIDRENPWAADQWYLTLEDEKYLSYYLLVK